MKSIYRGRWIVLNILLLSLLNEINAQCTYTDCGSATYTAPAAITGTATWPDAGIPTGSCIYVNSTLTVSGSLTLDNVDLVMDEDATIIVVDGGSLTIENATEIYAQDEMWIGIEVQGGGELSMDESEIYHAYEAIQADNSVSEEGLLTITESCFTNNEVGIYFGPTELPSASTSLIESTEFTAPALIAPKADEIGDYGVKIELDNNEFGIQIGNDDEFDIETVNHFHELGIGIRVVNSDATIQNCSIDDIDYNIGELDYPGGETLSKCYGIAATGEVTAALPFLLEVGFSASSSTNNEIEDVRNGIYIEDYVNSEIHHNRIVSVPSGTLYIMNDAIVAKNFDVSNISHVMKDNYIANYNKYGMFFQNADAGTIDVEDNTFITITTVETGEFAIFVDGSDATAVIIYNNTITIAQTGIMVVNTDDPEISHNTIDYFSPSNTDVSYGIRIDNCDGAFIFENQVNGNYSSGYGDKVRGIYIESSADFLADENLTENGSIGFYLNEPSVGGSLTCNAIEYNVIGIAMKNLGTDGVGPVGTTSNPSDNSWLPASTANRVYCFGGAGTDGASLNGDWVYRTSPTQYNIPGSLTTYDVLSSTDFNPTITSSMGTPCYPSFRTDEDSIAQLLAEMEYRYNEWLIKYLDEDDDPSVYYNSRSF